MFSGVFSMFLKASEEHLFEDVGRKVPFFNYLKYLTQNYL